MTDTWVIVYTNGGKYFVADEYWTQLVAAYHGWMERSHNRVLSLTGRDGAEIVLACSIITDLCRSTPDSRKASREFEALDKAESGFAE